MVKPQLLHFWKRIRGRPAGGRKGGGARGGGGGRQWGTVVARFLCSLRERRIIRGGLHLHLLVAVPPHLIVQSIVITGCATQSIRKGDKVRLA